MSRIEQVMRELSDLRAFYLQLQKARNESQGPASQTGSVEEDAPQYRPTGAAPDRRNHDGK